MIGKLLGHRKVQTTARYAHLARESVKTSAARVAESLAADMDKPLPLFFGKPEGWVTKTATPRARTAEGTRVY